MTEANEITDTSIEAQQGLPNRNIFTKRRIAFGLAAVVFMQNIDVLNDARSFYFGGGDMVPEVAGCEYTPPSLETTPVTVPVPTTTGDTTTTLPPTTTTNPTAEIEEEVSHERSSSRNNGILDILGNIPTFLSQKNTMYEFIEQSYVSEMSGIEFEIYRTEEDAEREINLEAFDQLFHLSLTTDIEHANPEIQSLMDCVRDKVLIDKELAGRTVQVLIPSTADYCINNWVLQKVDDRRDNDCTQSGAALPKIELEFLMFKPYSEQIFVVTAGDLNADSAEELNYKTNKLLVHEAIHRIFFELGIRPRIDADEQFTKYLENAVMMSYPEPKERTLRGLTNLGGSDKLLPNAVKYDVDF